MLFRSPKPQTPNPKPQTPNPFILIMSYSPTDDSPVKRLPLTVHELSFKKLNSEERYPSDQSQNEDDLEEVITEIAPLKFIVFNESKISSKNTSNINDIHPSKQNSPQNPYKIPIKTHPKSNSRPTPQRHPKTPKTPSTSRPAVGHPGRQTATHGHSTASHEAIVASHRLQSFDVLNASLKAHVDREDKFLEKVINNTEDRKSKSVSRRRKNSSVRRSGYQVKAEVSKSKSQSRNKGQVQSRLTTAAKSWLKKKEEDKIQNRSKTPKKSKTEKNTPIKTNGTQLTETSRRALDRLDAIISTHKPSIDQVKMKDNLSREQSRESKKKLVEDNIRKVEERKFNHSKNMERSRSQLKSKIEEISRKVKEEKERRKEQKREQELMSQAVYKKGRLLVKLY